MLSYEAFLAIVIATAVLAVICLLVILGAAAYRKTGLVVFCAILLALAIGFGAPAWAALASQPTRYESTNRNYLGTYYLQKPYDYSDVYVIRNADYTKFCWWQNNQKYERTLSNPYVYIEYCARENDGLAPATVRFYREDDQKVYRYFIWEVRDNHIEREVVRAYIQVPEGTIREQ